MLDHIEHQHAVEVTIRKRQRFRISLRDSLSCLRLALWDETKQRLIPFSGLRKAEAAI